MRPKGFEPLTFGSVDLDAARLSYQRDDRPTAPEDRRQTRGVTRLAWASRLTDEATIRLRVKHPSDIFAA